jgi:hypothetical protein
MRAERSAGPGPLAPLAHLDPAAAAGRAPPRPRAKAFERKRRRSRRILDLESRSPLKTFFTAGVEYDERTDLVGLASFLADFRAFVESLHVDPSWGRGVEIKFRRLGRHRADGLYYPEQGVLVVDVKSAKSFAHEFGHLMDYRSSAGGGTDGPHAALSRRDGFEPLRRLLVARLEALGPGDPRLGRGPRSRLSYLYFASPTECFARAFEQYAAETMPWPTSLAGTRERYREDPLFLAAPPTYFFDYFERLLAKDPCQLGGLLTQCGHAREAQPAPA